MKWDQARGGFFDHVYQPCNPRWDLFDFMCPSPHWHMHCLVVLCWREPSIQGFGDLVFFLKKLMRKKPGSGSTFSSGSEAADFYTVPNSTDASRYACFLLILKDMDQLCMLSKRKGNTPSLFTGLVWLKRWKGVFLWCELCCIFFRNNNDLWLRPLKSMQQKRISAFMDVNLVLSDIATADW